ncbi:MAG: hypothetical protein Kow00104_00800 [Rhodothalassiaceae bacterium]
MALSEALALAVGATALLAWLYMLFLRGGFWRADQLPRRPEDRANWPDVVAVIPARNEVVSIGHTLSALLAQDYPGRLQILVIDDGSEDGTADMARWTADEAGASGRVEVLHAPPLAPGWTGKLWALHHGTTSKTARSADWLWFVDADIVHGKEVLRQLMTEALSGGRDLVSLMVRLRVESFWEKLIVPAFIFFFQMLYPFRLANDPKSRVAAAAGGCVLVRRARLEAIGGIAAIRDALIDDCTLAARIKASGGRIWLGLGPESRSIRGAESLGPLWNMVRRTAYTQLSHNPLLLIGTVLGLGLVFLAPPLLFAVAIVTGHLPLALLSGAALIAMCAAYRPTLLHYGRNSLEALALPIVASLYLAMTVHSAIDHWRGRGSRWKGRDYGVRHGGSTAKA